MFVSYIVPVYKVEKYIRKCVESLRNQTYADYEIILVDDGSPDHCPEICDELAADDSRIRVIHKENGGLSDARNTGLLAASGEFVFFVDSDDFWRYDTALQELVNIAEEEKDLDFLGFNGSYYYHDSDMYKPWRPFPDEVLESSDKDMIIRSMIASGEFLMSACLKMIRREFLIEQNIRFKQGLLSEDIPWFIELLNKSRRIRFVNKNIYAYRQNVSSSITNNFSRKNFDDLLGIIRHELNSIPGYAFQESTKDALMSFMAYEFCILLSYIMNLPEEIREEKRRELLEYEWLLQYTINPKVRLTGFIRRIVGIRNTERILNWYQNHH